MRPISFVSHLIARIALGVRKRRASLRRITFAFPVTELICAEITRPRPEDGELSRDLADYRNRCDATRRKVDKASGLI